MAPNFTKNTLPKKELVDWLSSLNSGQSFGKQTVNSQINTAIREGKLSRPKFINGVKHLVVREFLIWAVSKKKWTNTLISQPDLKIDNTAKIKGASGVGEIGTVYVGEARDVLIRSQTDHILRLEAELDNFRRAKTLRSERAKQAGSLGGRPKIK